ncbi:DUF4288 domain-containing protein [Mucilaginibacter terrae]|nr:DUF4288 domain-containing protein [Mucilaginibacter terrae]
MEIDLTDWKLDSKYNDDKRLVTVTIHLKYPEIDSFLGLKPIKRIKQLNKDQINKLNALLMFNVLTDYEVIGTPKRPRGIKATLALNSLKKIEGDNLYSGVTVHNVTHAKKRPVKSEPGTKFYCVKMTVLIEIEKLKSKKQDIEERFVLIKATSADDAYEKLELQKDSYVNHYLNPYGRLVRWRIDSFDDCYETDIFSPKDIVSAEGVEVFSKLKSKKRKSVWDGKL